MNEEWDVEKNEKKFEEYMEAAPVARLLVAYYVRKAKQETWDKAMAVIGELDSVEGDIEYFLKLLKEAKEKDI